MLAQKSRSVLSNWLLVNFSRFKEPPSALAGIVTAITMIAVVATFITTIALLGQLFARVFSADIPTEELRNILIAIGALIGAPFLVWRTWVAHVAARANEEQATVARENLYTTLFTKAVEQLGATREVKETKIVEDKEVVISRTEPNTEVRLGAIYALERIAQDSERDHWPIMETLCSYVRNRAGPPIKMPEVTDFYASQNAATWPTSNVSPAKWVAALSPPALDVQAALTVVGRRGAERRIYEKNLENGSNRQLSHRLDLRHSNLSKVDLSGLNFSNARFDDSSLFAARLDHGKFNFASFSSASLCFAVLEYGSFLKVRFGNADAQHSNCSRADFGGAEFRFSRINGAHFFGAEFDHTIISHCSINFARLDGADLCDSIFHGNSCQDLCLAYARLDRMFLSESEMTSVSGLTTAQLSTSSITDTVSLPENLTGHEDIKIQKSNSGPNAEPPPTLRPIEVQSRFRNLRKKRLEERIAES